IRRQDRDGDARPRTGAPDRRRDRFHAAREGARANRRRAFLHRTRNPGSRRLHPRRSRDLMSRRKPMQTRRLFLAAALAAALWAPASAQEKSIVVASTTSTEDSGLFGHI